MILFPMYAVFVWSFCWRWRRRWMAYAALLVGMFGVLVVAVLHRYASFMFPGVMEGPFFPLLLLLEAVFILMVGLFISALPTQRADRPCRGCRYELAGLEHENPTCPECGLVHAAIKLKSRRCRVCATAINVAPGDNPSCPACGVKQAVREVKPPTELAVVVAFRAVSGAVQARRSRNTPPSASTPAGKPRIIVIRNPDKSLSSIR